MRDHLRPEDRRCPYCSRHVCERLADGHLDDCRARALAKLRLSTHSDTTPRRSSGAGQAERPRETATEAFNRLRALAALVEMQRSASS